MTQEMNATQKAALFLMWKACQRETTYYEALAAHCGLPTQGNALSMATSKLLTDVFEWCQRKGLPPLTSLVVRKSGTHAGCHGLGFWKIIDGTDLLQRCGLDVSDVPLTDVERQAVGKFLIVKTWNYFADLRPMTNIESAGMRMPDIHSTLGSNDGCGNFRPDPSNDLKTIFEILESIPGWSDLDLHIRENLMRGQTVLSAEIIHDRVTEIMLSAPASAAFAWTQVLKSK